jgi:hypothetical protein
VSLELVVADYDRIGSSDPIGRVELGYNRKGKQHTHIHNRMKTKTKNNTEPYCFCSAQAGLELKHWKEMVENPRRPIVHWHVLKVRMFVLCVAPV